MPSAPRASACSTTCRPVRPVAPTTAIFMVFPPGYAHLMIVTIYDNHRMVLILASVSEHQLAPYAESLSFLVSQVGARSAQIFAERLAPLGVSPRAFGVLSNLSSTGGHSQQHLADTLGIHRNNMVGLIDELGAAVSLVAPRGPRGQPAVNL